MAVNDYLAILEEEQGNAATNTLTNPGVKPEAAASAYNNRAIAPPALGMYEQKEVNDTDMARRATAISQTSPSVRQWAQDPVRAAATRDDFSALAQIGDNSLWDNFSRPMSFAWDNLQAKMRKQYRLMQGEGGKLPASSTAPEAIAVQKAADESASAFWKLVFSPFTAVTNVAAEPIARGFTAAFPDKSKTREEDILNMAEGFNFALGMVVPFGIGAKAKPRAEGEPLAPGAAEPPPPPRPTTPGNDGRFNVKDGVVHDDGGNPMVFTDAKEAAKWAVKAQQRSPDQMFLPENEGTVGRWVVKETGRFPKDAEPPPPGINPVADEVYAMRAEDTAETIKDLETQIAASKTAQRSPDLMKEFLDERAQGQSVFVSTESLAKVWTSGDDRPFASILPQIGAAMKAGTDVEIPLSMYLAEVSGKPFADTLRSGTRFGPEGVSLDEAKVLGETKEALTPLAAKVGIPEPAAGMVRMYHGGSPGDADGPLWFTTDSVYAKNFRAEGGEKDVWYVDVPEGTLFPYAAEGETAAAGFAPLSIQELPGEIAKQRKLYSKGGSTPADETVEPAAGGEVWSKPDPSLTPEENASLAAQAPQMQAAVNTALKNNFLNTLFKDAQSAGMTQTQFGLYSKKLEVATQAAHEKMLARAQRQIKAERAPEFKEKVAQNRASVEQAFFARPDIRAAFYLQYGAAPDGAPLEDAPKISTIQASFYDKDLTDSLPKNLFVNSGGLDPDSAAEIFGFDSGHEMLRQLNDLYRAAGVAGLTTKQYVEKMVKAQAENVTRSELGYDLTPEGIMAAAREVALAPEITELLIDELNAVGAKVGMPLTKEAVKAEALSLFEEMPAAAASNIRAFERNGIKLGRDAEIALLKEDLPKAFLAKQRQLLQHYMLIEAHKFKKEFDRVTKGWQGWASRSKLDGMDPEYQARVQFILNRMGFRTSRNLDEMVRGFNGVTLNTWIDAQLAKGFPIIKAEIPQGDAPNTYLEPGKMSVQDFRDVREMLASIAKNGRMIGTVFAAGKREELASVLEEMKDNGRGLPPKPPSMRPTESRDNSTVASRIRGFDAALRKIENMADFLDGGKLTGVFSRTLIRPSHVAAEEAGKLNELVTLEIFNTYNKMLQTSTLRNKLWQKIEDHPFTHEGKKLELFIRDIFIIALNTGNEYNMNVLAQGYNTTPDEVMRWLNNHLTANEWNWIQHVWNIFDKELFPRLDATQRRMTGVGLKKVEASPVRTAEGEIRGGYFPIAHDPKFSKVYASDTQDAFELMQDFVTTPSSMTKARTGAVKPLWLSLGGVLNRSLHNTITRIAYAEFVQSARNFIGNDTVKRFITEKMGPEYYDQFMPWLAGQIQDNPLTPKSLSMVESLAKTARLNWNASILGGSFNVMLSQPAGLTNSVGYLGPGAVARGIGWATKLLVEGKLNDFVFSRSEAMRQRNGQIDRDMREILLNPATYEQRGIPGIDALLKGYQKQRQFSLAMIGFVDRYGASMPTWLGAFWKATYEMDLSEAEAIAFADKVVRTTQGSGLATDLSGVQRPRSELAKVVLTTAYSYFNAYYNQQVEMARLIRAGGGGRKPPPPGKPQGEFPYEPPGPDPVKLAKGLSRFWWIMIAGPLAAALLTGDYPEEFDDPEAWFKWAMPVVFFNGFGGVPIARDIASSIKRQVTGKYSRMSAATPLLSLQDAVKWFATGEAFDVDSKNYTRQIITNTGLLFGVGMALQAGKTVNYLEREGEDFWEDLISGDVDAGDAWDFFIGITTGKEPGEK